MLYSTHKQYGFDSAVQDDSCWSLRVFQPKDMNYVHNIFLTTYFGYAILSMGLFSMILLPTSKSFLAIPLFIAITIAAALSIVMAHKKKKFHHFGLQFGPDGLVQWFDQKGKLVTEYGSSKFIEVEFQHSRVSTGTEECGLVVELEKEKYLFIAIGSRLFIEQMKANVLSLGASNLSKKTLILKSNIAGMVEL